MYPRVADSKQLASGAHATASCWTNCSRLVLCCVVGFGQVVRYHGWVCAVQPNLWCYTFARSPNPLPSSTLPLAVQVAQCGPLQPDSQLPLTLSLSRARALSDSCPTA